MEQAIHETSKSILKPHNEVDLCKGMEQYIRFQHTRELKIKLSLNSQYWIGYCNANRRTFNHSQRTGKR